MGIAFHHTYFTESFVAAVIAKAILQFPSLPYSTRFTHGYKESMEKIADYALKISGAPSDFDITERVNNIVSRCARRNFDGDAKTYGEVAVSFLATWAQYTENFMEGTNLYIRRFARLTGDYSSNKFQRNLACPDIRKDLTPDEVSRAVQNLRFNFYIGLSDDLFIQEDFYPAQVLAQSEYYHREFEPLPWAKELPEIAGQYARMSVKFPGQVSFYENDARMLVGRRMAMKPGRYLKRFYPDMDADDIRSWAAKADNFMSVQYADKAEDIVSVYTSGPNSCMSRSTDSYSVKGIHPVSAYESPDLKLAYIKNGDRVSARAVVWPEKKMIGRIYGDAERLLPLLYAAGYNKTHNRTFEGARLKLIKKNGRVVAPYVDGTYEAHIKDDFLVLGPGPAGSPHFGVQSDAGNAIEIRMIMVADIGEIRTQNWVTEHCQYSQLHDEYVHACERVITSINLRRFPTYNTVSYIGHHRSAEYYRCELDGRFYINDIPASDLNGFMVPTQLHELYRQKYAAKMPSAGKAL